MEGETIVAVTSGGRWYRIGHKSYGSWTITGDIWREAQAAISPSFITDAECLGFWLPAVQ